MTCSMERRLEIQLKDEREAFDLMRETLEQVRKQSSCECRASDKCTGECFWARAGAALDKANAVRPRRVMKTESSLDKMLNEVAEEVEKENKQREYDDAFDAMREALRSCVKLLKNPDGELFTDGQIKRATEDADAALAKADAARSRRNDDQPTPVKMEYREPLTLTDPDKDLIGDHVNKPCGEGGKP